MKTRELLQTLLSRNLEGEILFPQSRQSAAETGQYLTRMENEKIWKRWKVWNLWERKSCKSFPQVRAENSSLVKSRFRMTILGTQVSTRNRALGENQWWACDSLARDFQGGFEEQGKESTETGLWVLLTEKEQNWKSSQKRKIIYCWDPILFGTLFF